MKHLLIISLFLFPAAALTAQDNRAAAVQAIKQLADRYRQSSLLSFDAEYRYAAETKPGVWLDSLKGSFKIDGARYWYLLDSTEMVCGDKYVVILYHDDKVMYLSLPAAAQAGANPLAMLDSFLVKKDGLQFSLDASGKQTRVTIAFDKGAAYKKLEYDIDNSTGMLVRMISVVKSDQLYDPSVRSAIVPEESYAVIETLFRNYRQKGFDAKLFDGDHYFKKQGSDFTAVAPYNQYKIFLGKPGL